jgi:hypothetical protein
MSTSGQQPTFSESPTRQQLDELNALMQRMLALPVVPSDEAPDDPEPPAAPSMPPAPHRAAIALPAPYLPPALLAPRVPKGTPTGAGGVVAALERPGAEMRGTRNLGPSGIRPPLVPRASPLSDSGVLRPKVIMASWLRPLYWCTQVFDIGVAWTGPLGRRLGAPVGRSILAWTGLLLLAGVLARIAVDVMGWSR